MKKGNVILPILIGLLLLSVGIFVAIYFRNLNQLEKMTNIPQESPIFVSSKCNKFGELKESDYLINYKVQKGDTLLLIAKNQLGDPSRVNEIIELNKKSYPSLSLDNPFLEVDWNLKLPQKKLGLTTGDLSASAGEVGKSVGNQIAVMRPGGGGVYIYTNESTKYEGNPNIKVGDCVKAVFDNKNDNTAYYINNLGN